MVVVLVAPTAERRIMGCRSMTRMIFERATAIFLFFLSLKKWGDWVLMNGSSMEIAMTVETGGTPEALDGIRVSKTCRSS